MQGDHPRQGKIEKWREAIVEQKAGGKTVHVFCGERGISPSMFYYWKAKIAGKRRDQGRFIAVKSSGILSGARVILPNGVRIELGAGVESEAASRLLMRLCGINPGVSHEKP
jgi:hypothetical protein